MGSIHPNKLHWLNYTPCCFLQWDGTLLEWLTFLINNVTALHGTFGDQCTFHFNLQRKWRFHGRSRTNFYYISRHKFWICTEVPDYNWTIELDRVYLWWFFWKLNLFFNLGVYRRHKCVKQRDKIFRTRL